MGGEHLADIVGAADIVDHVRGQGMLLGVVLTQPVAAALEVSAREHGLLVNAVAPDVVRLAPPLILTDADLDEVARRWPLAVAGLS